MKVIELFTHKDPLFSYKIQKKPGYLISESLGNRNYEASFGIDRTVIELEKNEVNVVDIAKFTIVINDEFTESLCPYHLKVLYKLLSSTFNSKYDTVNSYVDNEPNHYFLVLNGVNKQTFNNLILFFGDKHITYNKHFDLLYEYTKHNEICISCKSMKLDEFLRYCYVAIAISSAYLMPNKLDDSFIQKIIKFIFQAKTNRLEKVSLAFALFGSIKPNEMANHFYTMYNKEK